MALVMSAQVFITAGQNQIHGPSLQPNPNATQRPRRRFEYVVVNDRIGTKLT
jgi:hypothetical protein